MSTETIEKTFPVIGDARLALANIRGSVEITGSERDDYQVLATIHLDSGDPDKTEVLIEQAEDGHVSLRTRFDETRWFSLPPQRPCKVDYIVRVPVKCELNVSGVSNSASIQGVSGQAHISTVSGNISLNQLSGALKIRSVSGDVSGSQIVGTFSLETVSGDLHMSESDLSEINAATVSGDITLHTPLSGDSYSFKSVSGDIALVIPPGTSCRVSSSTMSGSVRASQPLERHHKSLGHTEVQIGVGGPHIRHNSISGDLTLGDSTGEPLEATPQGEQGVDHMDVLERIERGELSVEDGLGALRS